MSIYAIRKTLFFSFRGYSGQGSFKGPGPSIHGFSFFSDKKKPKMLSALTFLFFGI